MTAIAEQNLQAALALADTLATTPPRDVVLSPGARNAPLVLAMADHPGLRLHVVLDERAAGFVALGLARATGRAALLVCTSGSAGGHYLPALMEAYASATPLVVLTADRPASLQHQGAAQTTDQAHLFGAHVRAYRALPTARWDAHGTGPVARAWQLLPAQALALAEGPMPGPVHLNVPFDEPLVPTPEVAGTLIATWRSQRVAPNRRLRLAPPAPHADSYAALLAWLHHDGPGAIVAGPLGAGPEAPARSQAIALLGATLGWPIYADPLSGLRFGPHRTKAAQALCTDYDGVLQADPESLPAYTRVLWLGGPPTSKSLLAWLCRQPAAHMAVVHEPGTPHELGPVGALRLGADIETVCAGLLCGLPPAARDGQTLRAPAAAGVSLAAQVPTQSLFDASTVWPTLLSALPPATGLFVGNSLAVRDFDRHTRGDTRPLRVVGSRGLNGIDGAVSTLLGLALGDPGRPWLAVVGDLTFLHDMAGLQAARQFDRALTVVVLNNGGGQIFRRLPIHAHTRVFDRYFQTPQKADMGALCVACAWGYAQVHDVAALVAALTHALGRPPHAGPHMIEVCLDSQRPPNTERATAP